jgi:hypothetical protein
MMRAISGRLSPAITIPAQTRTTDLNGTTVDLQGFGAAAVHLHVGIGGITFDGTNRLEFVMEHSDDGSTWAAVVQSDVSGATVTGTGIVRALVAAKAAADVQEIDYIGNRRYLRLNADFSGTHGTGTPIGAVVVRGLPDLMPAA